MAMTRELSTEIVSAQPSEDLTLATVLVRPSPWFEDDSVIKGKVLTAERYGAVSRVYVVAEDDRSWSAEFQRRMTSWNPGTEVRGLEGADHMPMFSKPRKLPVSEILMDIANKYISGAFPAFEADHMSIGKTGVKV